jgi:hypothetical protein
MADFAAFATAAEQALHWSEGDFMEAYAANRTDNTSVALDADLVAQAVVRFMGTRTEWSGSARELLQQLSSSASERDRESRAWPGALHVLSMKLRRAAPVLRELGVDVDADLSEGRGREKRRMVSLRTGRKPSVPSVPGVHLGQDGECLQGRAGVHDAPVEPFVGSDGRSALGPGPSNVQPDSAAGDAGDGVPRGGSASDFADWLEGEGITGGGR